MTVRVFEVWDAADRSESPYQESKTQKIRDNNII